MTDMGRSPKTLRAGTVMDEWVSLPRARPGKSLPLRGLDSKPRGCSGRGDHSGPWEARERQRAGQVGDGMVSSDALEGHEP